MTDSPRLLPAHVVVLVVLAIAAVVVGHHAGEIWQVARSSAAFPSEVRRSVLFAALFNGAVGGILALAWLAELVAATAWLVRRKHSRGRVVVRLASSLLPLAVLGLGHLVANPWVRGLGGQLLGALRMGQASLGAAS